MLVRSLRWVPPTTALAAAEDNEEALRIIKGRPFEVGFEYAAKLYRKEHLWRLSISAWTFTRKRFRLRS
jgi:hypothetical protein